MLKLTLLTLVVLAIGIVGTVFWKLMLPWWRNWRSSRESQDQNPTDGQQDSGDSPTFRAGPTGPAEPVQQREGSTDPTQQLPQNGQQTLQPQAEDDKNSPWSVLVALIVLGVISAGVITVGYLVLYGNSDKPAEANESSTAESETETEHVPNIDEEALAQELSDIYEGYKPDELNVGGNDAIPASTEERSENTSFTKETLRTREDVVAFLNSDRQRAQDARHRVVAALQKAGYSEDEVRQAVSSGDRWIWVAPTVESQILGTTYHLNGEIVKADGWRQVAPNDTMWFYVTTDSKIVQGASLRADCANPDADKIRPVRPDTPEAPPVSQGPTEQPPEEPTPPPEEPPPPEQPPALVQVCDTVTNKVVTVSQDEAEADRYVPQNSPECEEQPEPKPDQSFECQHENPGAEDCPEDETPDRQNPDGSDHEASEPQGPTEDPDGEPIPEPEPAPVMEDPTDDEGQENPAPAPHPDQVPEDGADSGGGESGSAPEGSTGNDGDTPDDQSDDTVEETDPPDNDPEEVPTDEGGSNADDPSDGVVEGP